MKRLTHFICDRFGGAVLTPVACAKRHAQANRQPFLPAGDEAHRASGLDLTPCMGCPIGASHAAGRKAPRRLRTTAPEPGRDAGGEPVRLPVVFPQDVPKYRASNTNAVEPITEPTS